MKTNFQVLLTAIFLLGTGIMLLHYAIDIPQATEKNEQGLAIGISILAFIGGNLILQNELRR